MRETVPDSVLRRADEIVLVDVTPEALLDRLRAGKIYPAARIDAALSNFFKIENLNALRETALRQVAENVEARRVEPLDQDVAAGGGGAAAGADRALPGRAAAGPARVAVSAQRLERAAGPAVGRAARRRGARGRGRRASLHALRQLASVLGAVLLVEEGDDVAATTARVAAERGITYILLGASRPPRGLARLREPLPTRLVRLVPGVDVRIVADRTRMRGRKGATMMILLAGAWWPRRPALGLLSGGCGAPRRVGAAGRAAARRCGGSCCRSRGRRSPAARSTRRSGWRAPRTRR